MRDLTADLLSEIHNDVSVEPSLTPLTGERFTTNSTLVEDDVRCEVRGRKAYLDVRVFSPLAKSYLKQKLTAAYNTMEKSKKGKYNQRILNVEHGSFTPLVFSSFGGMGLEANRFYHRLSEKIAEKRGDPLSVTKNWLRTRLSFSLLRSTLLCLRGS